VEGHEYVLDCLAVIRTLVMENGLWRYRVETNGPGYQHVTYLNFHVMAKDRVRRDDADHDRQSPVTAVDRLGRGATVSRYRSFAALDQRLRVFHSVS
jgi:hypothetical protein